ncbi:MAG TPA: Beta-galactosidase C-terminal domain [Ktedonobacteraceae bacterium]
MKWCIWKERALSVFGENFYAGYPALTEHAFGEGRAFYVATRLDEVGLDALLGMLQQQLALKPALFAPQGVEVTQRQGAQKAYTFVLNHLRVAQHVPLAQPMCDLLTQQVYEQEVRLPALGVVILVPAH